jgi:molecular chaperone DnaK (HSP70)
MVLRPRHSLSATTTTPLHTSEISWVKSECIRRVVDKFLLTFRSFKSVDPTHCHRSAHPIEHENTVAFKIQDKEGDSPSIVSVSEITSRHLQRLVNSASDYTGKKVTSAVVTVPTNFGEKQKEALIKAAKDIDLEIIQLIHEPVAAILAYDARPEAEVSDKIVVVADLGGTRSDVAVVASRGGMYTILATAHDFEFHGAALDQVSSITPIFWVSSIDQLSGSHGPLRQGVHQVEHHRPKS